MDIGSAFIADGEPAEAVDPSLGPLDHPTVAAQSFAAVNAAPGDAGDDTALAASIAAGGKIISFVGMEFGGPEARPPTPAFDRGDGVECRLQHGTVVAVGRTDQANERGAPAVDHNMALRARFAAIRRVGAAFRSPFFAGTDELSSAARLQSILPAWPKRSRNTPCTRSHTPISCQSRKRRQQVMPEPQPNSRGNICQGMPERSTNKMPVKTARLASRGRPPLGLGFSGGRTGSTIVHNSSDKSSLFMPQHVGSQSRFC
jgi:hypothetical protein